MNSPNFNSIHHQQLQRPSHMSKDTNAAHSGTYGLAGRHAMAPFLGVHEQATVINDPGTCCPTCVVL
jgi:hypothetical protein